MNKRLLLLLAVFISSLGFSQLPEVDWLFPYGDVSARQLALDSDRNIYMSGAFSGTVDVDPGPAVVPLISNGSQDGFLTKFDSLGNFIWAKQFGGTASDNLNSVVINESDEIFLFGGFSGTVDLDPGAGQYLLSPTDDGSYSTGFIVKLTPNGDFVAARKLATGARIVLDQQKNVILYGVFNGTIDFDPAPAGIHNITAVPSYNNIYNHYIVKLDSILDFKWARSFQSKRYDNLDRLRVDSVGNIYVVGNFHESLDFDLGPGSYNLQSSYLPPTIANFADVFMAKYDPDANLIWAKRIGNEFHDYPSDFILDEQANLYISGTFADAVAGPVDFDPNSGTYLLSSNAGNGQHFHAKYTSNGEIVWANNTYANPDLLSMDNKGNLFVAGRIGSLSLPSDSVDMDPGVDIFKLKSSGGFDAYLALFDKFGDFKYAKKIGGAAEENVQCLINDDLGSIYLTGAFTSGQTNLGDEQNPINYTSQAGLNRYFFKLNPLTGIMGKVFRDTNQNCIADFNESGMGNVTLTIQPGNIQVTTNSIGNWFVDSLPLGNYSISITPPNNYNSNCFITQNFTIQDTTILQNGPDFGLTADYGFIEGIVFNDLNGDCVKNVNEPVLANRSVVIQPGNQTMQTNAAGYYKSDTLALGNYTIAVDTNANWSATCVNPLTVNPLPEGSTIVPVNLGLRAKFGFIEGYIFNDLNGNCIKNAGESGLPNRLAVIQPGNQIVQTTATGFYRSDTLPVGNYTITADTSNYWESSCLNPIQTVCLPWGSPIIPSNIGLASLILCNVPEVSVFAPTLRPCTTDNQILVRAKNLASANSPLTNAYVILEINSLITITSANMPYTYIGNNEYQVNLGTLDPAEEVDIYFNASVSCQAIIGTTVCFNATLYPIDSCTYDTLPAPTPPDFDPCNMEWDHSSLSVETWCQNDSIYFSITNNGIPGQGDMACFSPVRIYVDGAYLFLDSVQLEGGETHIIAFSADGRTWRLEVDQHPLHPGNSNPNATIEACGDPGNWTPDLVNELPHDDEDHFVDIDCRVISGPFDPNEKIGYPTGVGVDNVISPNGAIDYVINFQNIGIDTAFTVVIRDTLDLDLDIFSVQSGVSSHPYTFVMHGPRVLEWTFANISLPDSIINEPASHGFVTFTVNQNQGLVNGTTIHNTAEIYFDFNQGIVTNTATHVIQENVQLQAWTEQKTMDVNVCGNVPFTFNDIVYSNSGTYYQLLQGNPDTLLKINFHQNQSSNAAIAPSVCSSYTAPDNQVYTTSGSYIAIIPNAHGCDSVISIDLTVLQPSSATVTETACSSYTAPDNQVYTSSGTYSAVVPNAEGCDSTITIHLTVVSLNNAVTDNSPVLHANEDNVQYQWLDCSNAYAMIAGETAQDFTAAMNGLYAVEISANSCVDTSDCILISGLETSQLSEHFMKLYPNPANGYFTVEFGLFVVNANLFVEDNAGRIVYSQTTITGDKVNIKLQEATGMYYVVLKLASGEIQRHKLMLE
ncbi:MAG TPA: T9SS type A sorting domain-containing protein [Fluviicola sp.]|nr:T9SS type A sorting domain-containing protein [Fluviicola sp.]